MNLAGLALVLAAGLLGPLLAGSARTGVPVVVGELVAGVLIGRTGTGWVHPDDPVLTFLATAGFALVMLVAGSHVPVRDRGLDAALRRAAALVGVVALASAGVGFAVAALVRTGHGPLYAVLLASSSAALVLPVVAGAGLTGPRVTVAIAQVALADTACIVLLPLVEQPSRAGRIALGALAVAAGGLLVGGALLLLSRGGRLRRLQRLSKKRHLGLELRVNLIVLFALAGLAQWLGVSVMLAGFVAGLLLAARGEPRRLARQLFSVGDGFLAPVFFVWLGASLDLRALAGHPLMWLLAVALAAGTVLVHAAARLLGQPLSLALLAGAQLGVPVAAVTIGEKNGLLAPGEGGAILAAALVSVAVTSLAARAAGARVTATSPTTRAAD